MLCTRPDRQELQNASFLGYVQTHEHGLLGMRQTWIDTMK
jgi:hypothetical protein